MYSSHVTGISGEDLVANYLIQNNYKIIERNFRCKIGEIDIIAQDKKELVFIEVKTRTQYLFGEPAESVTRFKQQHIYRCIQYYLMKKHLENALLRIDVVEVFLHDNSYKINHIKKAITENPFY